MKRSELKKVSAAIRKNIGKTYGFRQSYYINWMVKSGYFFCLKVLRSADVSLNVKPVYADDLWFDIFESSRDKRPMSLRGTGLAVIPEEIATYDFLPGDLNRYTEQDVEIIWQEIFSRAVRDIELFLQKNPDVDTYMPSPVPNDHDQLLYLMALLHNGRKDEVIKIINSRKAYGHACLYQTCQMAVDRFGNVLEGLQCGMDSYDCILKWCRENG